MPTEGSVGAHALSTLSICPAGGTSTKRAHSEDIEAAQQQGQGQAVFEVLEDLDLIEY